jgi:tetratricopeptide (TPR) repeat protein
LLEQVKAGPELAYAYSVKVSNAITSGASDQALPWVEKELAIAEQIGDVREVVVALAYRGFMRCQLGDHAGLHDLHKAFDEALRVGLGDEAETAGSALSEALWAIKGPAAALTTLEETIERSESRGLISQAMHARAETLWMLYDSARWDELLDAGWRVARWSEQTEEITTETSALPCMAQVLAWRQRTGQAQNLCERFLPRAREGQLLQALVPALAVAALVAQIRSKQEEAVALIVELHAICRDSATLRSPHLPTALRILVDAGELDRAENFAGGIEVTAARDRNCVLTGQAILAEAKTETEEARHLYREAAQRWADFGFVLEEGQADLGFARCLVALDNREAATEPLQRARAIFSRLGAVPLIKETDSLLQDEAAS